MTYEELAIIVQGPVYPSTRSLLITLTTAFPKSNIHYVHYRVEGLINQPGVSETLLDDPGPDPKIEVSRNTNIIRMLTTTYGSRWVLDTKANFIMKIRSDIVVCDQKKFLKQVFKLIQMFYDRPNLELAVNMNGSLDPYAIFKYPYHFSDWVFIERRDRFCEKVILFKTFNFEALLSQKFSAIQKQGSLKNYSILYQAEQLNHFFDKLRPLGMKNGMDDNVKVMNNFAAYIRSKVKIFSLKSLGITTYKRPKGIGFSHFFTSITPVDIYIIQKLKLPNAIRYFKLIRPVKHIGFYIAQIIDKVLRKLDLIS